MTDPSSPWDLDAARIDSSDADPIGFGWTRWAPGGAELATTCVGKNGPRGNAVVIAADGSPTRSLWPDPTVDSILPDWSPDGSRLSLLVSMAILPDYATYRIAIVGGKGQEPRIVETAPLSGNGGPAMFSPDGTLIAARAEEESPIPGDVLIVPVEDTDAEDVSVVRIPASQWSSVSWQPLGNPNNPAAHAPEGIPAL